MCEAKVSAFIHALVYIDEEQGYKTGHWCIWSFLFAAFLCFFGVVFYFKFNDPIRPVVNCRQLAGEFLSLAAYLIKKFW